jgi:hypothetical protein
MRGDPLPPVRLPVRLLKAMVVAILVVATITLVPFAYAEPPDPTWLGGLWDDDDFDTIVIAIMSTVAAAEQHPSPAFGDHVLIVVSTIDDIVVLGGLREPESPHQPRSPPTR